MEIKDFEIPKNKNAGVYMLYNITQRKIYVGCTSNFNRRATQHRKDLRAERHSNKKMQEDYNKGCEFAFAILEEYEKFDKDFLREREKLNILAFRDRRIEVYNHDTDEYIMYQYINNLFKPIKNEVYRNFHNLYGLEITSLVCCKPDTIRAKFQKKY